MTKAKLVLNPVCLFSTSNCTGPFLLKWRGEGTHNPHLYQEGLFILIEKRKFCFCFYLKITT